MNKLLFLFSFFISPEKISRLLVLVTIRWINEVVFVAAGEGALMDFHCFFSDFSHWLNWFGCSRVSRWYSLSSMLSCLWDNATRNLRDTQQWWRKWKVQIEQAQSSRHNSGLKFFKAQSQWEAKLERKLRKNRLIHTYMQTNSLTFEINSIHNWIFSPLKYSEFSKTHSTNRIPDSHSNCTQRNPLTTLVFTSKNVIYFP